MLYQIRTRIAPSPTGNLHLGTARAALCNYLFAKHNGGKFVLRIEDTDLERSDPKFEKDIIEGLQWLGIEWDEGIVYAQNKNEKIKNKNYVGEFAPYCQSERIEIYRKYLKKLLDENKAYYCFCTEEELEKERELQKTMGQPPKYGGKCANLTQEQVKKLKSQGKKSVIRFRIPKDRKIKFHDLIRGDLEFDSNLIGDIIIAKDENTPLYNFAVVIDDFTMQISHVIRGEDHLSNTPKQILMEEGLGFPTPEFAHLPLILGPDRSKLSKRHGATSITEYRNQGYLPEAMLNFMAFLGWNPKSTKEVFTKEELTHEFDLKNVGKAGAIFNIEKLDWINGLYIRRMSLGRLTEMCIPYLVDRGFLGESLKSQLKVESYEINDLGKEINFDDLKKVIALEQERIKKLSEVMEVLDFYFKKDVKYEPSLLIWKKSNSQITKRNLEILMTFLEKLSEAEFERKNLEEKIKELIAAHKIKTGEILWPMRAALSGKQGSPGPFEMAEVLGKERTLKRISGAIRIL